jgi:hypothetical protein
MRIGRTIGLRLYKPTPCLSTKNELAAKERRKLAAKARRDAACAETADRCGNSTEDDDAMDID